MKNEPRHYRVDGHARRYLCFRTQWLEEVPRDVTTRRLLLSLVPDEEEQHLFDVLAILADDPKLHMERDPDKVWPGP